MSHRFRTPRTAALLLATTLTWTVGCGAGEPESAPAPAAAAETPTDAAQVVDPTFEIRPHVGMVENADDSPSTPGGRVLDGLIPGFFTDLGPVAVGADGLHSARVVEAEDGWAVELRFTEQGSAHVEQVAQTAACAAASPAPGRIAVILEDEIVDSIAVDTECGSPFSGAAQLRSMQRDDAEALALRIARD